MTPLRNSLKQIRLRQGRVLPSLGNRLQGNSCNGPRIIDSAAFLHSVHERSRNGQATLRVEASDVHFVSSDDKDDQDMARLIRGDLAAMQSLMERYARKMSRYLVRMLKDSAEAADQVQEAFVRVYRYRERFNFKNRFSTWLYTIATNLARDRLRWRARQPQFIAWEDESGRNRDDWTDRWVDPEPTPDEQLQIKERSEALNLALAGLPELFRTPILLAAYDGESQPEIAAKLGCSIKAVEMRIYHARTLLRRELERQLKYENRHLTSHPWI